MTKEEIVKIAKGLRTDFKCESDIMIDFCNSIIKELEQEPCEDVVSRAEVKRIAKEMYLEVANMELDVNTISDCISCTSSKCREVLERKLQSLEPITSQEIRKGHWIKEESPFGWDEHSYQCSECTRSIHLDTEMESLEDYPYCHCGAKMQEVWNESNS